MFSILTTTRREPLKSAPYLRLKNHQVFKMKVVDHPKRFRSSDVVCLPDVVCSLRQMRACFSILSKNVKGGGILKFSEKHLIVPKNPNPMVLSGFVSFVKNGINEVGTFTLTQMRFRLPVQQFSSSVKSVH